MNEQTAFNYGLTFKVAPHIVEDLGLNLYTSLPRALVEFVANAYDADSPDVSITLDIERVREARKEMREAWKAKYGDAPPPDDVLLLEEQTLPADVSITVEDYGHGMDRTDLNEKFLVAGRRRREVDGKLRSPDGRVLMGRKGLGKLAGFGIAKNIEITSRKKGDAHATQVVLAYDELIAAKGKHEIPVKDVRIEDGAGIEPHGTKIVLRELIYAPMKSKYDTISREIAAHFAMISPDDFDIAFNGSQIEPEAREYRYAWPEPDEPMEHLAQAEYRGESGQELTFRYRIRFTAKSLAAAKRGVRVYAHKRLASVPSLLDTPTGMHGFRMTDYLDGEVHADFVDEQRADYIASDRQSLRWESQLLAPMREHLSAEMKAACTAYQKVREKENFENAKQDEFTTEIIEKASFGKKARRTAFRIAGLLAGVCHGGTEGEEYRTKLENVIDAWGHGDLVSAIARLAEDERPEFSEIAARVSELTSAEFSDFGKYVKARIDGIKALRKICEDVNFAESRPPECARPSLG